MNPAAAARLLYVLHAARGYLLSVADLLRPNAGYEAVMDEIEAAIAAAEEEAP